MSYIEQMNEWLKAHPDATQKECYKAGYFQCTDNWCNRETFKKNNDNGKRIENKC